MRKLNNMNLDVYLYIKEFEEKNNYCPSYRDILENTNYKAIASINDVIYKLEELGMIKATKDKNGNIKSRTIRYIEDEHTKELIEELRSEAKEGKIWD